MIQHEIKTTKLKWGKLASKILHICRQSIHSVTVTVQIKEKKITYINKFRMIVLQLIARKEMRKLFADLRVLFTHNDRRTNRNWK